MDVYNQEVVKINSERYSEFKIEKLEDINDSIFKNNYFKGLEAIKEIIGFSEDESLKNKDKTTKKKALEHFERNNVICFSGERGAGKTSCMNSFVNLIVDQTDLSENSTNYSLDKKQLELIEKVKSYSYYKLPTIEPKTFKKNGNILEILLTYIYTEYEGSIKENMDVESKPLEWYKLFNKVYDGLRTITNKEQHLNNHSATERLGLMSNSMKLETNLKELIDLYLSSIKPGSKYKYLLVTIDDLDLEPEHAKEMIEQIRKYLLLSNVIVLVSLNLEEFSELLGNSEFGKNNHADQYLAKLFPEGRRIYMPTRYNVSNISLYVHGQGREFYCSSIDSGIRELIYSRTGLLFKEVSNGRNRIVPKSLRNIVNMVVWLFNMEEFYITKRKFIEVFLSEFPLNNSEFNFLKIDQEVIDCFSSIMEQYISNSVFSITGKSDLGIANPSDSSSNQNGQDASEANCKQVSNLFDLKEFNANEINNHSNFFISHINSITDIDANVFKLKQVVEQLQTIQEKRINSKGNRLRFMEYFRNNWMKANLSNEYFKFVDGINSVPVRNMNKYIINNLNSIFGLTIDKLKIEYTPNEGHGMEKHLDERKRIALPDNNPSNVSFGDMLYILNVAEKVAKNKEQIDLIFAIRSVYSYWLYEYYNEFRHGNDSCKGENYLSMLSHSVFNTLDHNIITKESAKVEFLFSVFYEKVLTLIFSFISDKKLNNSKEELGVKDNKDGKVEIADNKEDPDSKELHWSEKMKWKDYKVNSIEMNESGTKYNLIELLNAFESIIYCIPVYREISSINRYRNEIYYEAQNIQIYKSKREKVLFDIYGFFSTHINIQDRLRNIYVHSSIKGAIENKEYNLFSMFEKFKRAIAEIKPNSYMPIYEKIRSNERQEFYLGTIEAFETLLDFRSTTMEDENIGEIYIRYLKELTQNIKPINEKFKTKSLDSSFINTELVEAFELLAKINYGMIGRANVYSDLERFLPSLDSEKANHPELEELIKIIKTSNFMVYHSAKDKLGILEDNQDPNINVENYWIERLVKGTKSKISLKDDLKNTNQDEVYAMYNKIEGNIMKEGVKVNKKLIGSLLTNRFTSIDNNDRVHAYNEYIKTVSNKESENDETFKINFYDLFHEKYKG